MIKETKSRSIFKTLTWRALATLTTMLLVYLFSKNIQLAATIGAIEVVLKLIAYYIHERIWQLAKNIKRRLNAVLKSISWRLIASLITGILVFSFGLGLETASIIGGIELAIKLLIYYIHEEVWLLVPWGIQQKQRKKKSGWAARETHPRNKKINF